MPAATVHPIIRIVSILALLAASQARSAESDLVSSGVIPGLTTPPGTSVTILGDSKSSGLASPTALAFGPHGEVYITETRRFGRGIPDNRRHLYWVVDDLASRTTADRMKMYEKWQNQEASTSLRFLTEIEDSVRVLGDPDEKGVFRKQQVFAGGFNDALDGTAAGVFEYEGTVFLACIPKIYALRDTDGDGTADKRDVIQDGFGVHVSLSGHDMNGFVLGPDGRIYGSMGDRGFNGTTREGVHYNLHDEGFVFRFDPDGSNFEVIHTGLRNPKEIAFDDLGNLISVDNNCDNGDKARVVYIVDGGETGWHMGHQALLTFHNQIGMEKKPPCAWMSERMWDMPNPARPAYVLPPVAHLTTGPSGLTYHPGAGFLESEVGRFFVCDYRGGAAKSGIWSFRVEPTGAGMKMTDSREFNWGVAATDVDFSWDGELTVTDFIGGWTAHEGGRVYAVSADKPYLAKEAAQAAALVKEGFEKRSVNELASLLFHPDQRIRIRAQLALTRRSEAVATFTKAAKQTKNRLVRLHGVWGLGIVVRRGAAALPGVETTTAPDMALREEAAVVLRSLLADEDIEVRSQAIKMLGESGLKTNDTPMAKLIADESPRVRFHAAIAAGRMKHQTSLPAIVAMLKQAADDPYLRHAGSYAISLMEKPEDIAKLANQDSPVVRMSAVIALRRLKSPELAVFLNDADPLIVDEAIRAINDLDIASVRPQVAALLDKPFSATRSEMIWRRLLHSAFRAGDETNARRVLKAALDKSVPAETRAEAFRLLAEWTKPAPVDQSTGRHSPLPERPVEPLRKVLDSNIANMILVEGALLDAALTVVRKYELDLTSVPDEALRAMILNEDVPGIARVDALELYALRKPDGFSDFIAGLATSVDDRVAIAALSHLAASSPEAAIDGLAKAVVSPSAYRQQQAWKLCGSISTPAAADLIARGLAGLQKSNGIAPGALELIDAAGRRDEANVKSALAAFKAAQAASQDALAQWLPSLEGGDAARGGEFFESHPAGQCMRCHSTGHGGGDAGPDLSDIGKRVDRRYLLESLVNPGAKVAIGYGIASATLKGGKSVAGILVQESETHVDIDSAGTVYRVARKDIETMTPPVSSMPPMAMILQPAEIRDVVAWLAGQNARPAKKPARPKPVAVSP